MNSFNDGFWSLFIIVGTLGGIAAMFLLLAWTSHGSNPPGVKIETMGHVWDEDLAELNNPLPRWWLIMFYLTLGYGVLYLLLYPGLGSGTGFLTWSSTGQYEEEMADAEEKYGPIFERFRATPVEELADDPDAVRVGGRLYAAYCTGCHGSDAAGNVGFPNLRDKDWLWGGSGDQIKTAILQGRNGVMPGWAAALGGEAGVMQVTHFVRKLSGAQHDAALASAGEKQYATLCVACHGPTGDGNAALGAPRLNDGVWLYGGSVETIAETLTNGRSGQMPAHESLLGEAKSHVLAAFIYNLSKDR
jgi:cytochrome c oxidase cbb3-type subunit 3